MLLRALVDMIEASRRAGVNPTALYICGATEAETLALHKAFEAELTSRVTLPVSPQVRQVEAQYKNFRLMDTMIEFRTKKATASPLIVT